jgi:hypothetical protein
MLPVIIVYAGFVGAFLGGVSILKPLRFLGIRSRLSALSVLGAGLAVVVVGWLLPPREVRIGKPKTHLDEFAPVYQFNEFHSARMKAPRDRVFKAIKEVRADEIFLFRTLTWVRRFGRASRESILNPGKDTAILDVATRSGFLLLSEESDRELVFGTPVIVPPGFRLGRRPTAEDFKMVRRPGFAIAVMNFRLEDDGPGVTVVTTETRIYATDSSSRRRFGAYWRVIYPGSSIIRWMWLRAIRRRAEYAGVS